MPIRVASSLVAMLLVGACSLLGVDTFEVALDRWPEENDAQVIVTLADSTGLVIGIERPPDGVAAPEEGEVAFLHGDHAAIMISWLGGACDESVALRLDEVEGGRSITGTVTVQPMDCDGVGLIRSLVIRFLVPVELGSFIVTIG